MADLGSRTLAAVLLHSMSERVCWPDLRLAAAAMALRVAPAARAPVTPPSMSSMLMHIKMLRPNKNKLCLQMDKKVLKQRAGCSERINTHMKASPGSDVTSIKRILGFAPSFITKNIVKGATTRTRTRSSS